MQIYEFFNRKGQTITQRSRGLGQWRLPLRWPEMACIIVKRFHDQTMEHRRLRKIEIHCQDNFSWIASSNLWKLQQTILSEFTRARGSFRRVQKILLLLPNSFRSEIINLHILLYSKNIGGGGGGVVALERNMGRGVWKLFFQLNFFHWKEKKYGKEYIFNIIAHGAFKFCIRKFIYFGW